MSENLSILIPMAGLGSRLRPLTWSRPKPLLSLAGATVLDHLLAMFKTIPDQEALKYVFIMSPGQEPVIKAYMQKHHPEKTVHYVEQRTMRGQSDALWQAREHMDGPTLAIFSDTLIDSDFSNLQNESADAIAWVKPVPDPRRFGVAEVDPSGCVMQLTEKPNDMHNNLAVVGCYYFKEGKDLSKAIKEQVSRNISLKGEYFLVDAINILLEDGAKMRIEQASTWLDAGTSEALLDTNRYLLEHGRDNMKDGRILEDSIIRPPVFIHPEARVSGSIIGPFTSIGANCVVQNSSISDSILSPGAHVSNSHLDASLIGYDCVINSLSGKFNLGDNSWASS